ncbi:hypothetical protein [Vibrio coralliilyticus]|uniref:hypothetical protein n=1 Tax=Vibrio coralliilyticus TaxID=190893 RepID=UPI001E46A64F|nr:hypothetical protein [Vibrio coralliilyticus]MCC2523577.1 hypothetical protein [Vibrio coralliilyticus]
MITGNAGDGKTAFLQQLEIQAQEQGASVTLNPEGNGARFELNGHHYISNYDGSQDEADKDNDAVLSEFFSAFKGVDNESWPLHETRLIAINEGRLVDFLTENEQDYPALKELVEASLKDGSVQHQIAVVNLNMRDVLACNETQKSSIFERLLSKMTAQKVWQGCDSCGLKDKCYVKHNVSTFQDEQTGNKVIQRLAYLYKLTNLRNQLHITMRDLRSALAYMLVGKYSCSEIKELYANGESEKILQGYYYNSWCGEGDSQDRLLRLLKQTDIAQGSDVRLDRGLDFIGLASVDWMQFEYRSNHEQKLIEGAHQILPTDTSLGESSSRYLAHQNMLGMLRRRAYFERRGENWRDLLPYRVAKQLVAFLSGEAPLESAKKQVINAINRGEGLHNPMFFEGQLAMQVRKVALGTIKSYRVFPQDVFTVDIKDAAMNSSFIEHSPQALVLKYQDQVGLTAELDLNLDLFEMLLRLNQGYLPSAEAEQSYYLSLTVFKNVLASAPYQEVLLTTNGRDYQKIERKEDGLLALHALSAEAVS